MSSVFRLVVCLLVVCSILVVSADYKEEIRMQVCGHYLNMKLKQVCRGRFNTMTPGGKRSDPTLRGYEYSFFNNELDDQSNYADSENTASWNIAHQHQPFQRVRRGGIVEECCRKPCTEETMREFCG